MLSVYTLTDSRDRKCLVEISTPLDYPNRQARSPSQLPRHPSNNGADIVEVTKCLVDIIRSLPILPIINNRARQSSREAVTAGSAQAFLLLPS
jgi:hypothetical protein